MQRFIARYRPLVTGVLSGFDRLVFRGSLLPLMREGGMFFFLERAGVRLLDFKDFVTRTSDRVKQAAYAEAARLGRPVRYLESSDWDKEKIAERVLAEQPIDRGLICVLTAVEPCMSFEYHRSADRSERGLRLRPKKCLHLYKYFVHPQFGFMSARLQTWFPFNVQICLNGREWLARQLRRHRSDFKRADNCFTWLANLELAQRLMDEQLQTEWPAVLGAVARDAFRNRDIRGLIHRSPTNLTPGERRRLSAKTSRQLRLLRAHGVIKKIPKTHRYRLTANGLLLTAALQATRRANIKDLLKVA